jgi:hypothetical protein
MPVGGYTSYPLVHGKFYCPQRSVDSRTFAGLCEFDASGHRGYNDRDSVRMAAISTYVLPVKRLEARPSVTLS